MNAEQMEQRKEIGNMIDNTISAEEVKVIWSKLKSNRMILNLKVKNTEIKNYLTHMKDVQKNGAL